MRRYILLPTFLLLAPLALLASVDADLLALVPPGAKMVGSIDVAHAQSSAFGQFLLVRMNQDDQHLDQLAEQTGFDPRRDLQHVMFASFGPNQIGASHSGHGSFAVLGRGIFDTSRISAIARSKGSTVIPYYSWSIITSKAGEKGATGLVFPQADVAIFGDLATVETILDNSTAPAPLDAQLQQLINAVGAKNDAWFASIMPGDSFTRHLAGPAQPSAGQSGQAQAQALQSIRQSSGGVHFGDTVDVSFDAVTRSPQDATSLADVVRFGASFIQMQQTKDQRSTVMANALDRMTLTTGGDNMHLAFSLPEKDMEQLAQLGSHGSAPHGPAPHVDVF